MNGLGAHDVSLVFCTLGIVMLCWTIISWLPIGVSDTGSVSPAVCIYIAVRDVQICYM